MSELTSFYITESAEMFWPASSIRADQLAHNARMAADFIYTELAGLTALPTATINIAHLPHIRQMEMRLAARAAQMAALPPVIRTANQQVARAEQIAVRMNSLHIARSLPVITDATRRIQQAASAADAAMQRGDVGEAERQAQTAAREAAQMERQVQAAVEARSYAMTQAGDALARAAGLFAATQADAALADWILASRPDEAREIAARLWEAQTAYAAEDYTRAQTLAQQIAARAAALTDAAETGVSRRQMEANARAAVQTLTTQGFGCRTEILADGALKVCALDGAQPALDIVFQPSGEALIDSHTHGTYRGEACSVVVGRFLAAYRERVRLTDLNRSLQGVGGRPGKGAQQATRAPRRRFKAAEMLQQTAPRRAGSAATPPPAVLAAWNRLKH